MIIKSIIIENFLCYFGTENSFDFGNGPTIIFGQNKSGKSKLFDAFNWVLYDKAYDTDKESWEPTSKWGDNIVNLKAKKECLYKKSVNTSVSLKFNTENNEEYFLTREFAITNLGKNKWDVPSYSELSLTKTDKKKNDTFFEGKEVTDIIKGLFPENLSKYFFFQGENISHIMRLNSRSDFTKALKDLSRIEIFEKVKHYSNKVYKSIENEFQSKEDNNKEVQKRKIELSKNIDFLNGAISSLAEQKENYIKERDKSKEIYDNKNDELRKYEECSDLIHEIELLKKDLEISTNKSFSKYEEQKKDIFEVWMYAGTEELLNGFINLYLSHKREKKIPEPISQDFINEMLHEQICKICNRKAQKGSNEFKNIESFLNDKAVDKQIELIMALYSKAEVSRRKYKNIQNEIKSFYEEIEKIGLRINEVNSRIKVKEKELENVIPKGLKKGDLETVRIQSLKSARDNSYNDYIENEGKIKHLIGRIEAKQDELRRLEKEFKSIIDSSTNKIEREKMKVAERLKILTNNMHDYFLKTLYKNIEDETNKYYSEMTKQNPAISGKVKIDYEEEEIYTVDNNSVRLVNLNQANKVSLQISFVASILSVSNKFWVTYFPFIADAPISALGGNNKLTAIETMIDTFSQSILILKDDAFIGNNESVKNDPVRKLIKNNTKIENSYELLMEGDSIENQRTLIKKFK